MKCFPLLLLLLLTPSLVRAQEPFRSAGDRPIDIRHIRLDLRVDLPKSQVDAVATLKFQSLGNHASISLDAVEFEVLKAELGGEALKFRHDGKKLNLDFPAPLKLGQDGELKITYRVRNPRDGLFFFQPTKTEPEIPYMVWSQGEAITNRYWIPCLDHPDQRQSSEMIVTAETGYEVVSNGKLVSKKDNGNGTTTFHWSQEKTHVSYLMTLVVGKFAVVEENWKGLPVTYYVPPKRKPDIARTFGRTREMLDFFSTRFGIDYPWEKYAQVVVEQFTAGGMENTSATTLTDRALHDERSFLDSNADGLIAHELGHQWWGDLVTCRDWAHLWLNEGFASFCEVIWAEHHDGSDEAILNLWGKSKSAISGGKDRPIVDRRYNSPRMMFDARAYPKGAWVLHMLRARVGQELFWKAMQAYGTEHKYKTVETSDLRRTFEKTTGKSLERFFHDWTERPGSPSLDLNIEYLPSNKAVKVTLKQTQAGEAFYIPVEVLVTSGTAPDGKGPIRAPKTETIFMSDKEMTAFIPVDGPPASVQVDPRLVLLATLNENKGRDLWEKQLTGGTMISRLRAATHFGKSKQANDRELLATALKNEKFHGVAAEIASALAESGGDVSRDALLAGLKHSHPKVRRACADQLAKFPRDTVVAEALKNQMKAGDPSYYVEAAVISAYASLDQGDTLAVLLPQLGKESHADVIQAAVLSGLGSSRDWKALDTLISWSQKGRTRVVRVAAINSMVKLAKYSTPDEKQRTAIMAAIGACLTNPGEMPIIRRTAVTALRDLGQIATTKLDVLEVLQRHDPDEFVQDLIGKAISAIRSNSPLPEEVNRLRDELEKLRKQNSGLQERLDRLEKTDGKGWGPKP